jgi:uridylate kinase
MNLIKEAIKNLRIEGVVVRVGGEGKIYFSTDSRTCVLDLNFGARIAYDIQDANNSYRFEEADEVEDVVRDVLSLSR